jgi:hypothetical protein
MLFVGASAAAFGKRQADTALYERIGRVVGQCSLSLNERADFFIFDFHLAFLPKGQQPQALFVQIYPFQAGPKPPAQPDAIKSAPAGVVPQRAAYPASRPDRQSLMLPSIQAASGPNSSRLEIKARPLASALVTGN